MKKDLIEIEAFCQTNDICSGCPHEDECFESFMFFGVLHAKEWMEHFTCIIYTDGECR